MTPLPIDPLIPEILACLRVGTNLVIVAPPGAGKTTRVPPALVKAELWSRDHPALMMLQPRRIAARAAARRIAEENGWTLGEEVGYQVRFEKKVGPRTRLRVVTEGILNRQLLADPFLEGIGAVVLDEFHERSLHTDLAIALLREVQQSVREDLRLIVMSATLDVEPIARFLGNCPVMRAEGRPYPIEISYHPFPPHTPLPEKVARAVGRALEMGGPGAPGDLLVFLPGAEEIRRSARELEPLARARDLLVLPLHGSLPAEEQDRALRPADRRKVVLATNVAETSLTIEGVSTVIDSGLARYARHDPARGLDRLELGRISRASAAQRAGRAGRTGPGRCLRLWAEREARGRPPFAAPEIPRGALAATVLALHAWGQADPATFGWFEPPPAEAIAGAERLLRMLGALEGEPPRLSPIGAKLLALPVPPRLGRLLLAASEAGWRHEGAALAALLSEKDIVPLASLPGRPDRPAARGRSDLLVRLDLLAEAERARFASALRGRGIDPIAARQVARARDDLLRIGRRLGGPDRPIRGEGEEEALLRLALLAYPDRVARRREPGGASGV
ncbi:MAG: ATP-dependent RNA helicase, partial [Isosphaeraceae bacterium]|nr:ATP-dependent RNA helicase [Isosphaeraceae bacterium]